MNAATPPRIDTDRPDEDSRLTTFFRADTDDSAATALAELLSGDVSAAVSTTVRRELATSAAGARYIDDVIAEVRLRLVRRLWRLRDEPDHEPIQSFTGYAAVTAERTAYAFLRTQFPERTRFRNRLRYAVSRHPSTRLFQDASGIWQCETTSSPRLAAVAGTAIVFVDQPARWLIDAGISTAAPLPQIASDVLMKLDRAIEFDRLVDALAAVLGITDVSSHANSHWREGDDRSRGIDAMDPAPGAGVRLEQRESLLQVWREIVELPPGQRAALLLNLRDPDGGAILQSLPATGVVSSVEIAGALGILPSRLAELWDTLPLDDLSIAAQLGITRQQVINLRKSARARLARRLK